MNAAKTTQHTIWSQAAPAWKKHDERLRRTTREISERMVAHLKAGDHVLDIASGTGEPALVAAERVGPSGRVLGFDFVEEMLAFAREKAAHAGLENVEFRRVDGEELDVPAASFDGATMRWGLMFMPDAAACLARVRRALKPGGTLTLTCWGPPPANPWVALPISVLGRYTEIPVPPPGAPGIFAFADRERLRATIAGAGFSHVEVEPVELLMSDFDRGADYVTYTLEMAGPIAAIFSKLPPDRQAAAAEELAREAERAGGGRPHLRGMTWLATAR